MQFNEYIRNNPNWQADLGVYQRDDETFRRIPLFWKESEDLNHEYHACINVKTGSIYLDDTKNRIFFKQLMGIFYSAFLYTIKTIDHLTFYPICLVYQYVEGEITGGVCTTKLCESFEDFFWTPLYTVCIIIVQIISVILGLILPNTLYHTREVVGFLDRSLMRNPDELLYKCFSPFAHVSLRIKDCYSENFKRRMEGFVKAQIENKRQNAFFPFPSNTAYLSPRCNSKL